MGRPRSPTERDTAAPLHFSAHCCDTVYASDWPQYNSVSDRQDREQTDRICRTVLQTIAQKVITARKHKPLPANNNSIVFMTCTLICWTSASILYCKLKLAMENIWLLPICVFKLVFSLNFHSRYRHRWCKWRVSDVKMCCAVQMRNAQSRMNAIAFETEHRLDRIISMLERQSWCTTRNQTKRLQLIFHLLML